MNITDSDTIIKFLSGNGTDHILRTYSDMLELNNFEMEKCHDQIQWLFPLHEFSKHARTCPILNEETVEKAKEVEAVKSNLLRAKDRFERFLAIGDYEDIDKQRKWCSKQNGRTNHNLLRVTRVIRCFRLFGLEDEAKDFYDKVVPVGDYFGVGEFTLNKWKQALTDNVWTTLQD